MANQRKLSNVRLTREFHFRHMGLWVATTVSLVVALNLLLYVIILQQWGYAGATFGHGGAEAISFQRGLVAALTAETLVFCLALILMARTTSHRIAGAFLGLKRTCERVRSGETAVRQHFRQYDHLEELERAFNTMLDELTRENGNRRS